VPTPREVIASCRAFAIQNKNTTVAEVLNDAADQIESLLEIIENFEEGGMGEV